MTCRNISFAVTLCAAVLLGGARAYAVPPKNPGSFGSKPADFKPCHILRGDALKSLQKRRAARLRAPQDGLPRTEKVIVIRVKFIGEHFQKTQAQTEAFFEDLKKYFLENSYGLYTVSTTVTSNEYAIGPIEWYNGETEDDLRRLRNDAVNAADTDIDFRNYDYVMIYHTGMGQEEDPNNDDLVWSMFYAEDPPKVTNEGERIYGLTIVPELSRPGASQLGVICHEFGHQLGLPDLYDISFAGGRSTCGSWSLMDYPYGHDNTGTNPPHLDPWSRSVLGFIDLDAREVVTKIPGALMNEIQTSSTGFYKLPVDSSGGSEYFIVEYRSFDPQTVYDRSLPITGIPGKGVLAWHIDEAVISEKYATNTVNTTSVGTPHRGVDLVEADGWDDFYRHPTGKPGDSFGSGDNFATPRSDSFDGQMTGLTFSNINISAAAAGGDIRKIAATPILAVSKLINYPNPAGKSYFHPRMGSGVLTTVVFQATRPPRLMTLTIYDLAGSIIKTASKEDFTLKVGPEGQSATDDNRWVFEYDWDGKNDGGENIAGGVYLYRIKADDEVKVGKLAIVR